MEKKILIIDDDPLICSTLEQALQLQGYAAQSVHTGNEGLELVARWHPDVILLDHHMPGMTGIEFLQVLRDRDQSEKREVIYLTSDADIVHVNEALELGVATYLNKSEVQVDDIVKVVESKLA